MKRKFLHFIHGIKGALIVIFIFLLFPFSRLFLWSKNIWIITEREKEARDNGYVLFKYIRKNYPSLKCYYAIDFSSPDYLKIRDLGNIIKFGSFKHFFYFCGARKIISTNIISFCPSYYLTLLRRKIHLFGTYVFIDHGISKDDMVENYKKNAKIDLYLCGGYLEYLDIKEKYGYKDNELKYTGFARFDNYYNIETRRQVLIMPTWRRGLDENNLLASKYYQKWSQLLSSRITDIANNNNVVLKLYLHPLFQKFSYLFIDKFKGVEVCSLENSDVQQLLKESSLLITDYSSVFFDFAYMRKPLIYYHFDEDEFFSTHYKKGYFSYYNDGFGLVAKDIEEVEKEFDSIINNSFVLEEEYKRRADIFFPLTDNKNCERIYKEIKDYKR